MKKLLLALVGVLIVSVAVPAVATKVKVFSDGTVWLEKFKKVEVVFGPGVFDYGDTWKQAFTKKGTVVPVKSHTEAKRYGMFHVVKKTVVDIGIVYDNTGIHLVHSSVGEQDVSFNPYAFFWLMSVVSMVIATRTTKQRSDVFFGFSFVFAFIASLASAPFTTFAFAFPLVSIASTTISFAIFITLIFADDKNKKLSHIFFMGYGITMVVSMGAFLLS